MCVQVGCDAESVCGVEQGVEAVDMEYLVELRVLLMRGNAEASSSSSEEEIEAAVALWLSVNESAVSVRKGACPCFFFFYFINLFVLLCFVLYCVVNLGFRYFCIFEKHVPCTYR